MEVERGLSRNTTLEFEKLVKVARDERDAALARQREADEAAKKSFQSMKRYEDTRELFKNKADNLTVDLAKANAELKLHLEVLEKVQAWTAKAMLGLHLTPQPLQDRSIGSISSFFSENKKIEF